MRHRAAWALVLTLCAGPATAEETDNRSTMERGMELFFEGLREEMAPTVDSLRGLADEYGPAMTSFLKEMGPALAEMLDEVKDWSRYHKPEFLPNGDILIRRKQDPERDPEEKLDPLPPAGPTDI